MKRLLFSGHDFKFLQPVITHYENEPGFTVLIDTHKNHVIDDERKCEELNLQSDIVFCEWALGNAVWYSRHKLPDQKLIIRLHRQELTLPYLDQIDWKNVDRLIHICPYNVEQFNHRYPNLSEKVELIYNPIDACVLDQEKLPGTEFNLGMIGISPMLKAPHIAVEMLRKLREHDRRFTLFIKGKQPWEYDWLWKREIEREYFEELYRQIKNSDIRNAVIFDPHGNDIPDWFSKIGFILSTSDLEGSHQAVAEGMASGAIPVIRNWAGSDMLYPPKYVFSTVDQAVELILKWRSPKFYSAEVNYARDFAKGHFDLTVILPRIRQLIGG
jgi:glycosyltransferase involved in cell wall biosynthesis